MERTHWFCKQFAETYAEVEARKDEPNYRPVPREEANLVSSLLGNGKHAPAIDIDLPCELRPSKTPGHFHLLIDREMTWEQYRMLLAVMAEVGIVEEGYYRASCRHGMSYLRTPEELTRSATS